MDERDIAQLELFLKEVLEKLEDISMIMKKIEWNTRRTSLHGLGPG